jgi:hypothetical protein
VGATFHTTGAAHRAETASSWLLLMIAASPSRDVRRLGVYLALLRQAAMQATAAAVSRLIEVMANRLLEREEQREHAAAGALAELRSALGAGAVVLIATAAHGAPVLRVSIPDRVERLPTREQARGIVVVQHVPNESTMVLAVAEVPGLNVTPHERRLAHAAASLPPEQAREVVARLVRLAHSENRVGLAPSFAIGIASRTPGDPTRPIVQEAREEASRRSFELSSSEASST